MDTHNDFYLTDDQLAKINQKFEDVVFGVNNDDEILEGITPLLVNQPRNCEHMPDTIQCNLFTLAWVYRPSLAIKLMESGLVDLSYTLKVDASVNSSWQGTPDYWVLYTAVELYDPKSTDNLLDFLVQNGIDLNLRDVNGQSFLWKFIVYDCDIFRLLKSMASKGYLSRELLNIQDNKGQTIFTEIINKYETSCFGYRENFYPMLELLVRHGADLNLGDGWQLLMDLKPSKYSVRDQYEMSPYPCRNWKSRARKQICLRNCTTMSLSHGYAPKFSMEEINASYQDCTNYNFDYEKHDSDD